MHRYWISFRILPNGVMVPTNSYEAIIKGNTIQKAIISFKKTFTERMSGKKIYTGQDKNIVELDIIIDETLKLDIPLQT